MLFLVLCTVLISLHTLSHYNPHHDQSYEIGITSSNFFFTWKLRVREVTGLLRGAEMWARDYALPITQHCLYSWLRSLLHRHVQKLVQVPPPLGWLSAHHLSLPPPTHEVFLHFSLNFYINASHICNYTFSSSHI